MQISYLAIPLVKDYLYFVIPPMHQAIEICKYTLKIYQFCLDSILLGILISPVPRDRREDLQYKDDDPLEYLFH